MEIDSHKLVINLPELDGKPFEDRQIGGMETYFKIKDAARSMVTGPPVE